MVVMRIPLSWLKEYIPLNLSIQELAKTLTMAGLEVDGWESKGDQLQNIVVARVVESVKHPEADKLSIAQISDGTNTYQVVCAAPNCRTGLKTAFAPIGTKISDSEGEFIIKKAKLRGVESSGMLCAGKELGLNEEADKIMEFSEDIPEGTLLADLYGDTILDISLTPNLNHCASVMGIARELAAITNEIIRLPQIQVQEAEEEIRNALQVEILDLENCPRYACRLIKNVKVAPSPDWLKKRIEASGLRSINNVVDVTNFVLLEMGQPLHAFDFDRIEDQRIIVRKAAEGEVIQTLDGKEYALKDSMLMICDSQKPVAIAGIMGGLNSEVSDQTRAVVLESAYFDSMSIRRTSKTLGISTDAAKRFERGSDPNQVLIALDRAAELIQKVAGGEVQKGVIDVKTKEFPEKIVSCRLTRINQVLGTLLSRGEVETIFSSLHFPYQWDGVDKFMVTIPTYRVDISREIDLVEEVARLYGYDNIPRIGGRFQASTLPSDPVYLFEKEMRSQLIAEGLQEFLTCDLIGPSMLQIIRDQSEATEPPGELSSIKVLNPTSIEQSILRTSLLPALLQVVKHNDDHQIHEVAGFEIGRIHFLFGEKYVEQSVAGIILTGKSRPSHWGLKPQDYDFYDLKGMIENVLNEFGVAQIEYKNMALDTFHTGRQASIFIGSLEIGSFGEIHPAIQRRLGISQRILFGEVNLQDLMRVVNPLHKVSPLAIYPGSTRDWTCTIKEDVAYDLILELIQTYRPQLLESVSLKDIYRSEKLPAGYQNMTFHFAYRDLTKTVEQEIIEKEHNTLITTIVNLLAEQLI